MTKIIRLDYIRFVISENTPTPEQTKQILRDLREAFGFSQTEFGQILGVNRELVNAYEAGRAPWRLTLTQAIVALSPYLKERQEAQASALQSIAVNAVSNVEIVKAALGSVQQQSAFINSTLAQISQMGKTIVDGLNLKS